MKPYEFWNSTYREINLYVQANLCKITDTFKQEINLQEAATNKTIMADAMSNKKPKIISLHTTFKNLFSENKQNIQSPQEIAKMMRRIMKSNKI